MPLLTANLEREFIIEKSKTKLTDPNPEMSPDHVMDFYASQYPELTTATVHGPQIENDKLVYQFKTTVGTKA